MKINFILLLICTAFFAKADFWTQKADFGGTPRYGAVGFSIGETGYIGTGSDINGYTADFWSYHPAANAWNQVAALPGPSRTQAIGFAIGSFGYCGLGWYSGFPQLQDWWEYNPEQNSWTQKANFTGQPRYESVGFCIGNYGYIATGHENADNSDGLWRYDPLTNSWKQLTNFGGMKRKSAVAFSIGGKGYVGTGFNDNSNSLDGDLFNDFWEYDPVSNSWAQKAAMPAPVRWGAAGFAIGNRGYIPEWE